MKNKCKAMTLVELICVVAIVAVLIAIGVLGMNGVRRFKAERQIHTMTGELSDLRHRAMAQRTNTAMAFTANDYVLDNGEKTKTVPYEEELTLTDVTTANKEPNFTFSPSGRPSNSGTVTFRVGERAYRIIVAPVNGRIRMEQVDEEE